ncbi:aspartate dehydrogenase [Rhodopseudomonas sp. HC1]|uniref:aspartate dehydrogenase n=1 Tax=Rhodopseudomonas infernalis TaxID=2897386 RepID=UPI001EE86C81|nr:aspartate dehydrogenase [Rhodopseudomonas infernalis]MCG6205267.1 aspartate dehydrogenase [Rhodopseudomonas infernalis]
MKIAVIGYGAIGRFLIEQLDAVPDVEVAAIYSVPTPADRTERVVTSLDALLATRPDLVVECAGHRALSECGEAVLRSGVDLLVVSVGALADPALEQQLRTAARNGGRLLIAAGALGGLDALSTAREAGLDSVSYVGKKAPAAWTHTPAEDMVDLTSITSAVTFLECDARTAALRFPQNANVVAAIALAGLGFERTQVSLVVDPASNGNNHSFVARGAFGEIAMTTRSATLPANPKTSMLAPYSLVQSIKKRAGLIIV